MKLRLLELQDNDKEAKVLKSDEAGLLEGWEDDKGVLHYHGLPYVLEIICFKVISCHYNDPLIGHFEINKTQKLVARKYYWPTLCCDV